MRVLEDAASKYENVDACVVVVVLYSSFESEDMSYMEKK